MRPVVASTDTAQRLRSWRSDLNRPGQSSRGSFQFRRRYPGAGIALQGDVLRLVLGDLRPPVESIGLAKIKEKQRSNDSAVKESSFMS